MIEIMISKQYIEVTVTAARRLNNYNSLQLSLI